MADVKWIKITTDIFDDEKILMIESMPAHDTIIVIWFKLLALAGKQNNDGVFIMGNRIPYTEEMLSSIFRRDINMVRLALSTFKQFGMIDIIENVITIPNWNKHQTLDAYEKKKERDRIYQADRRQKQKQLALGMQESSGTSSEKSSDSRCSVEKKSLPVAFSEEDKEEEEDKDKEKDKNKVVNYQQIADMYNDTCVSLPRVTKLSEKRKKAIKARLNTYTLEDIKRVFEKAEQSNFLKGSNPRNWSANFDWLINDNNMAKVLDGNFDNKGNNRVKQYNEPKKEDFSAFEFNPFE